MYYMYIIRSILAIFWTAQESKPEALRTLLFEGNNFIPLKVTMSMVPASEPIAAQRVLYAAIVKPITTAFGTSGCFRSY
jgi:hypothetical protein